MINVKFIIGLAIFIAYSFIAYIFVLLISGFVYIVHPDTELIDGVDIVNTDTDTTISKAHLIELKKCATELENNQFIIYTMNKSIRTKDNTITSLQKENKKLKYQIEQHNAKVKNPKSKYWIDTGTN